MPCWKHIQCRKKEIKDVQRQNAEWQKDEWRHIEYVQITGDNRNAKGGKQDCKRTQNAGQKTANEKTKGMLQQALKHAFYLYTKVKRHIKSQLKDLKRYANGR